MLVELLAGNPGLNRSIEILGVDPQDSVHLREVETNAAGKGSDVPLERGPRTEGDDRCAEFGAETNNCRDLFGIASKGDRVRSMRRMIGLVLAVLGADRRRGGEAIAEQLAQRGQQRLVDRLTMKRRCGHCGSQGDRSLNGISSITPRVELRQSD